MSTHTDLAREPKTAKKEQKTGRVSPAAANRGRVSPKTSLFLLLLLSRFYPRLQQASLDVRLCQAPLFPFQPHTKSVCAASTPSGYSGVRRVGDDFSSRQKKGTELALSERRRRDAHYLRKREAPNPKKREKALSSILSPGVSTDIDLSIHQISNPFLK